MNFVIISVFDPKEKNDAKSEQKKGTNKSTNRFEKLLCSTGFHNPINKLYRICVHGIKASVLLVIMSVCFRWYLQKLGIFQAG